MPKPAKRPLWSESDKERAEMHADELREQLIQFLARMAQHRPLLDALRDWRGERKSGHHPVNGDLLSVLKRFSLPPSLRGWAWSLALTGVNDIDEAEEFIRLNATPSLRIRHERFGVAGSEATIMVERVEVSVPKGWTRARLVAFVRAEWMGYERHGVLRAVAAGRPAAADRDEALAAAVAFDATLSRAENAKSWDDHFKRWMKAHRPKVNSTSLFRRHIRPAVRDGSVRLPHLQAYTRTSKPTRSRRRRP